MANLETAALEVVNSLRAEIRRQLCQEANSWTLERLLHHRPPEAESELLQETGDVALLSVLSELARADRLPRGYRFIAPQVYFSTPQDGGKQLDEGKGAQQLSPTHHLSATATFGDLNWRHSFAGTPYPKAHLGTVTFYGRLDTNDTDTAVRDLVSALEADGFAFTYHDDPADQGDEDLISEWFYEYLLFVGTNPDLGISLFMSAVGEEQRNDAAVFVTAIFPEIRFTAEEIDELREQIEDAFQDEVLIDAIPHLTTSKAMRAANRDMTLTLTCGDGSEDDEPSSPGRCSFLFVLNDDASGLTVAKALVAMHNTSTGAVGPCLELLEVATEWRMLGIGRQMMQEITDAVALRVSRSYPNVMPLTATHVQNAHGFFVKMGFEKRRLRLEELQVSVPTAAGRVIGYSAFAPPFSHGTSLATTVLAVSEDSVFLASDDTDLSLLDHGGGILKFRRSDCAFEGFYPVGLSILGMIHFQNDGEPGLLLQTDTGIFWFDPETEELDFYGVGRPAQEIVHVGKIDEKKFFVCCCRDTLVVPLLPSAAPVMKMPAPEGLSAQDGVYAGNRLAVLCLRHGEHAAVQIWDLGNVQFAERLLSTQFKMRNGEHDDGIFSQHRLAFNGRIAVVNVEPGIWEVLDVASGGLTRKMVDPALPLPEYGMDCPTIKLTTRGLLFTSLPQGVGVAVYDVAAEPPQSVCTLRDHTSDSGLTPRRCRQEQPDSPESCRVNDIYFDEEASLLHVAAFGGCMFRFDLSPIIVPVGAAPKSEPA